MVKENTITLKPIKLLNDFRKKERSHIRIVEHKILF